MTSTASIGSSPLSLDDFEKWRAAQKATTTAPTGGISKGTTSADIAAQKAEQSRARLALEQEHQTLAGADTKTGAPAIQRLLTSLNVTPEGQLNYLESKYPPDKRGQNVVVSRDGGEIYFRPKDQDKFIKFNPSGMDAGDFLELIRPAIEMLGPAAAGATGGPGAAVGTAGALEVVRQALASGTTGEKAPIGERIARVGLAVGGEGLAQGGVAALSKGIETAANVPRLARGAIPGDLGTAAGKKTAVKTAQQNLKLAEEAKVPLRMAQATGSEAGLATEGFLRRNFVAGRIIRENDEAQIKALSNYKDEALKKISKMDLGKEGAGNRAGESYRKYLTELSKQRSKDARANFSEAIGMAGDDPVVPVQFAIDEAKQLAKEFSSPLGGPAAAGVAKQLGSMAGAFEKARKKNGAYLSIGELQNALQLYSGMARGTGTFSADLTKTQTQMIGARMVSALEKDMDDLLATGGKQVRAEALSLLKAARDQYKIQSQAIIEARDSFLGKIATNESMAGENVTTKIWNAPPSQIREAMQGLGTIDPKGQAAMKRALVEKAIDEFAGGAEKLGKQKLQSVSFNAKMASVFTGDKEGLKDWLKLQRLSQIVGDRRLEGSPTEPISQIKTLLEQIYKLNPNAVISASMPVAFARLITKPVNRKEFLKGLELYTVPKTVKQGAATMLRTLREAAQEDSLDAYLSNNEAPRGSQP